MYGYLQDKQLVNMYSAVCQSNGGQHRAKHLEMQCSSGEVFTGGPVMKGFQYKVPVVYRAAACDVTGGVASLNFDATELQIF